MATTKGGIAGSFSGKVGSVVGYRLRGTDVIRGLPKLSNKKPSAKQLAHRLRFKLIQEWRSYLTGVFAITFKNHTAERSAQNAAHRFNNHIVTGEYPNLTIDRSLIVISQGNLPLPQDLSMVREGNMLHFTWNKTTTPGANELDIATILVWYDEESFFQVSFTAGNRHEGQYSFALNYHSKCKTADVYFTMLSNDREKAADSVYMGRLEL